MNITVKGLKDAFAANTIAKNRKYEILSSLGEPRFSLSATGEKIHPLLIHVAGKCMFSRFHWIVTTLQ
jgi:hypothetical protein